MGKHHTEVRSLNPATNPPSEADGTATRAGLIVFDEKAFLERLMADRPLAQMIMAGFLDDCPKTLESLRSSIISLDRDRLNRQAHSLKGAAATISAVHMSRAAFAMEEGAKRLNADELVSLLEEVELTFANLKMELTSLGWQ